MIRQLQKKFLSSSMFLIGITLILLVISINVTNVIITDARTTALVQDLSNIELDYFKENLDGPSLVPLIDQAKREKAVYFTVYLDSNNNLLDVDLDRAAGVSESEALEITKKEVVPQQIKVVDHYKCHRRIDTSGNQTLVYLNLETEIQHILLVFLLSLLFATSVFILLYLFLKYVTKKYSKPYKLNLERQKQFITDAGHELKTPLSIILANTEAMELRNGPNKYTNNIKMQIERLSGLTENLLTLSKIDEEAITMKRSLIVLDEVIKRILDSYEVEISDKKLSVSKYLSTNLTVQANPELIYQLFSTLIENAMKYTNPNGKIVIELYKTRGTLCFEIKNECDIRSIEIDKIFDRFYRGDSSRSQNISGFGIGLSAARSIAQGYGGDISASLIEEEGMINFKVII